MSGAPAFALTGVEKRFPGFTLGPIDLDLEPGTVLGFVGPNGSGKSTTLGCIAGLVAPRLLLLDEPTTGLDPVVRSEVLDVLWEVLEDGDHAIFYSTHILSDIGRLADELVFLRDGRILLRSGKDALTDGWRRISFRLGERDVAVAAAVEYRRVRAEHQVVSADGEATLAQLRELGAEAIEQSRMTIDEIAVTILKGGSHVAVG